MFFLHLARKARPHAHARLVYRYAVDNRVRTGKVDELEYAGVVPGIDRALSAVEITLLVNEYRLARRHVAHALEAQGIERHAFRGDQILRSFFVLGHADYQRPDAERIAKRQQAITGDHRHDRISAPAASMHPRDGLENGRWIELETGAGFLEFMCQHVEQHLGIRPGIHMPQILAENFALQALGIGQVAVMAQDDPERGIDIERLGFGRRRGRPGGRIPAMRNTDVARQDAHVTGTKNIPDQPATLVSVKLGAFGGYDAGSILPAMLKHQQPVVEQLIDGGLGDNAQDSTHCSDLHAHGQRSHRASNAPPGFPIKSICHSISMRRLTSGRIQTFSVGFERLEYDERAYARQVAERFATDHHELVVKPDAASLLSRLVWHYNEPFADPSALPSFSLCESAREFVTVALNGDGGDEAFLGYDRYLAAHLAGWYDRIPSPLRRGLARGVGALPQGAPKSLVYRLRRFTEALALPPQRRYAQWMTYFANSQKDSLYTPEFAAQVGPMDSLSLLEAAYKASDAPNFLEASAHADVQLYLPDDLLVKMDIASMAHSLEVRAPFLDHKVVEFAASLPPTLKLRKLTRKYLLKKIMNGVLPEGIIRRKKMGFAVPIHHWFRDELWEMACDLLMDQRARQRGYFRPEVVRRYLDEHRTGKAYHHFRLWNLLMLELWHRMFIDQSCPIAPPCQRSAPDSRVGPLKFGRSTGTIAT